MCFGYSLEALLHGVCPGFSLKAPCRVASNKCLLLQLMLYEEQETFILELSPNTTHFSLTSSLIHKTICQLNMKKYEPSHQDLRCLTVSFQIYI